MFDQLAVDKGFTDFSQDLGGLLEFDLLPQGWPSIFPSESE
jgi:hypothetical protein